MPPKTIKRMPEHRYLNRREMRGGIRTDEIHAGNVGKAQELAEKRRILIEKQYRESAEMERRHESEHETLDADMDRLVEKVRRDYAVDPKELLAINKEIIAVIKRKAVDDATLDRFTPEQKELIRDAVEEIIIREKGANRLNVAAVMLGLAIIILGPKANRNEIVRVYEQIKARVYSAETREVRQELTQQQENLISQLSGVDVSRLHSLGIGVGTILLIAVLAKAMKIKINDSVIYEKLVIHEQQLEQNSLNAFMQKLTANDDYEPSEEDEEDK